MRFAVLLLIVLAVACSIGSFVTQQQSYAWYAQQYSERTAALIIALRLDDTFHSWWFIVINAFLCVNLLLCNVLRLPQLVRRSRAFGDSHNALKSEGDVRAEEIATPEQLFRALRMPRPASISDTEEAPALFASKNRAGLWGAWICHLGILLLILGFSLGQMTQCQYSVYGVPGQSKPIGDTPYMLTIDDFRTDLHPDGTAEQYTADITVTNTASVGPSGGSASISVNHPASLCGMKFYQNSIGWASRVQITESGALLQDETLCAGEYLRVADKPELVICLNAFYPDYELLPGTGPASATDQLNNPAYLYSVYYQDQILGMNVLKPGEPLTIDEYEVHFSDPRNYTLIQIKKDHFTWLALLGGLTALAGLVLALYIQPVRMWATKRDDGSWTVRAQSRKGGAMFRERFLNAAGKPQKGN